MLFNSEGVKKVVTPLVAAAALGSLTGCNPFAGGGGEKTSAKNSGVPSQSDLQLSAVYSGFQLKVHRPDKEVVSSSLPGNVDLSASTDVRERGGDITRYKLWATMPKIKGYLVASETVSVVAVEETVEPGHPEDSYINHSVWLLGNHGRWTISDRAVDAAHGPQAAQRTLDHITEVVTHGPGKAK